MAQFVGKGARPISAHGATAWLAIAIPQGADADLAGHIADGLRVRHGWRADGFGEGGGHNATLRGVGAQAIRGVDLHIGLFPVLAIVVDRDIPQRGAAISPVVELLRGAANIKLQLGEKLGVLPSIPF